MKRKTSLAFALAVLIWATPASAATLTLYDSRPSPVPGNEPSLGYQCCQVRQLGQGVTLLFGGAFDNLTLNILMSNWAFESTYEPVGTSAGFSVPMTATVYNVGPGNTVGSVIATQTASQFIPWRAEPGSGGCAVPTYRAADGNCYNGSLSNVAFNFGSVIVPGQVIYGLAFNTQTVGYSATGAAGPYNSLNQGLTLGGAPSVGSTLLGSGYLYVDGQTCYPYDGTNGQVCSDGPAQVFRSNGGWSDDAGAPYNPSASITGDQRVAAVPEPGTMVLLGTGLFGIAVAARRRRAA